MALTTPRRSASRVVPFAELVDLLAGDAGIGIGTAGWMAVHTFQTCVQVHVGAGRKVRTPFLPARRGMATHARFVARLPNDVGLYRAVRIEPPSLVQHLHRLAFLYIALDGREPGAGRGCPPKVPRRNLFLAGLVIVLRQVAREAIGLQYASLTPVGLIVVAVEVVVPLGGKAAFSLIQRS